MSPISDMLIRIKNAQKAAKATVAFPYSKFKHEIAKVLERSGLVEGVDKKGRRAKRILEIKLGYKNEEPLITEVKLLSKSSRRIYSPYKNLRKIGRGGTLIVSTPKGVMSSTEAFKAKVGGELIAEIF